MWTYNVHVNLQLGAGGETAIGQVEETATERNEPSHLHLPPLNATAP